MEYKFELLSGAKESLSGWPKKHRDKINHFLYLLAEKNGILDEPYSKHIRGKIRELRIDFGKVRYRLLYALLPEMVIVILAAFRKNTEKTPENVIRKAEALLKLYQNFYEKK